MSPATTPPSERRLNRPKDKDDLMQQLVDQGPFKQLRDVLVFAAALGWYEQQKVPLEGKSEPIRWDVATHRRGTEALANMIAAADQSDPEIVGDDRFDDRLDIFEQYANGGLEKLRGLLAADPRAPVDVVLELVQKACRTDTQPEPIDLVGAADNLEWS